MRKAILIAVASWRDIISCTIVVMFLFGHVAFGQIGINNTSPNAILDIRSSNQALPAFNDGVLIPKIDDFSIVNPTSSQDGMLVFATGNGTPTKGFHYWNSVAASWVLITGGGTGGGSNTLDQAYDQGGAGIGKNINATDGAVRINGEDGFLVTGAFAAGNAIDTEITGAGTRMFFNPNKSAFRAGTIYDFPPLIGNEWDDVNIGYNSTAFGINTLASGGTSTALGAVTTASGNISTAFGSGTTASGIESTAFGSLTEASGNHSVAFGYNTTASATTSTVFGSFSTASGTYSTAFGQQASASGLTSTAFGSSSTASGDISTAFGIATVAPSYGEIAIGIYNTTYTPISTATFDVSDRLFTIGNGTSSNRSNALTIYKNGLININDAYDLPLADGTVDQVMTTDGNGVVSFQSIGNIFNGNTLDAAYDQGGAGSGRIINATHGPVEIHNNGGFIVESANLSHMLFVDGSNDAVGISTAVPTATLSVNGTANKPGGGSWAVFSDARLKENISNYHEGLALIKNIYPINFTYNAKMQQLIGKNAAVDKQIYQGVIAQELQKIAPDMVREVTLQSERYLEVDPNKFTYALINAVKEQQEMINKLQDEIMGLKTQLNNQQKEIETIKALLKKE